MDAINLNRQFAWGPILHDDGSASFRLWAPALRELSLRIDGQVLAMERNIEGWFETLVETKTVGTPYGFVLPDGRIVSDPASRQQATDVSGLSILGDPHSYRWQNRDWKGRPWEETIIYEIHIGTFTREGTFRSAISKLEQLASVGITTVEIMTLAQFPGGRGWGYDGVLHYAPHNAYGLPDDFKAFVDAAHGHGLMVFLDVVYNHFGPEGNFLADYAPDFFHSDNPTPWGPRIAFERDPVRRYFLDNVVYWLREFRVDGLRFDAIDQIDDSSPLHILEEIPETAHAAIGNRRLHLITENPANGAELIADRAGGGRLYTADWNDDFHHVLHVIVTGENQGYYAPFREHPWEKLRRAMATGYLRQGKHILGDRRVLTEALSPTAFVHFLQNHDQVGNRALGNRLHTMVDERALRVLTEILFLSPQIPLLFMGDDHLSSKPFRFFSDYQGDLAAAIRESRPKEAENFGGLPEGMRVSDIPDPSAAETFLQCKLDWQEISDEGRREWSDWLRRLIGFRRDHIVPPLFHARGYAGSIVTAPERCLFVDWRFVDVVLHMRANLSEEDVICDRSASETIYPSEQRTESGLPPWSATLFMTRLSEREAVNDDEVR